MIADDADDDADDDVLSWGSLAEGPDAVPDPQGGGDDAVDVAEARGLLPTEGVQEGVHPLYRQLHAPPAGRQEPLRV
eukprot:1036863-Prorocentrum_minimum.AAC.1